jgi:hypothetical protein|tara:strand:- start:317 stop:799 length:483 start_codon:yes stop_codon:yes gene_type:complete
LIEKNKLRKKRPRPHSRRPSIFKQPNGQHSGAPKSRGHIARALERYINLAQDAHSNGDRIVAENFYQYAEHYQRLLNENKAEMPSPDKNIQNPLDKNNSENKDTKLSRTQRAINAKDERIKKVDDRSQNKSSRKENFTRDGLEALKPFQSVVSEEKTQSS